LLCALNPFTARHLRKLWHHSARILRFLEDFDQDRVFRRLEVTALIEAVLAGNGKAIVDARMALIDAQEVFCLRQLLRSDAPLTPGSGVLKRAKTKNAAINRRKT
jgi:DNA-binding GntR family transcriptional regulator